MIIVFYNFMNNERELIDIKQKINQLVDKQRNQMKGRDTENSSIKNANYINYLYEFFVLYL
jgi:hypothetical protein